MITAWTKHLPDPEDRERFERRIRSSVDVLDRLRDILKEELSLIKLEDLDFSAGWEYRQAAQIGRRSQIERLLKLLDHGAINDR